MELFEEMQRQIDSLLIEKRNLQKRAYVGVKDYEKRATPFRNLFDDMRALKKSNEKLKNENKSINETLQSTIASLQSQMQLVLTTALKKRKELEEQLAAAEASVEELTAKLEAADTGEI